MIGYKYFSSSFYSSMVLYAKICYFRETAIEIIANADE